MPAARLVAITKPLVHECMTAGEFIVYAARVSNPENQANRDSDARLLAYLIRNRHWSPFEMVSATVEIVTTRDIARQMLRHRSFSFQEFSQRYAGVDAEPVLREIRLQDKSNRQSSIEIPYEDNETFVREALKDQLAVHQHAMETYQCMLRNGIAKEVARAVLPEGLTPSTLYMQGTFRSWLHYLNEREAEGTQKEHREVAALVREVLAAHEPLIFGAA